MDSNYYNHHLIDKLTNKATRDAMPIKDLARALNLSIERLCAIIASEHGYVCLETRQRIQEFLGVPGTPMTWRQCNEGTDPVEVFPPRPEKVSWFVWVFKKLRGFRAWFYKMGEGLE